MRRALTAGFVVVVTVFVGTTVWFIATTIADGVSVVRSFDADCSEPSNVVYFDGSCARPLHADDFVKGRAKLTLILDTTDDDALLIDYLYENRTSKYRSLVWAQVELTTPTGSRVSCSGDDSTQRYSAPPHSPRASGYGCGLVGPPGRYVATYEGVEVAHLDVPSNTRDDGVRATA